MKMVKGESFRSLFFFFRSLDNFQYRAVSLENIIGGMRDHILNQEETLEVLSTFIREFEPRISSSIESLINYIVNTGKIETILITFYGECICIKFINIHLLLRAKTAVQLVSRNISKRIWLGERAKKYFSSNRK